MADWQDPLSAERVRLLFISNFILAQLRADLGATHEGYVKYGMVRAFNGTILMVPDERNQILDVYEVLFWVPEAAREEGEKPQENTRRCRAEQVVVGILGGTVKGIPEGVCDSIACAEQLALSALREEPEALLDQVRLVVFSAELRVLPGEDIACVKEAIGAPLAEILEGEVWGGEPSDLIWRFEQEIQGISDPNATITFEWDFEVRLARPLTQQEVVQRLKKLLPEMQEPIFGNWGSVGIVDFEQQRYDSHLHFLRVITRHWYDVALL